MNTQTTAPGTRLFATAALYIALPALAPAQTYDPENRRPAARPATPAPPQDDNPQARLDPAARQAWESSVPAAAQPAPQPGARGASLFADDMVYLPTFAVVTHKDIGYIAVDSLAGGRTSMSIKLTPSAMSSLTRTFLDDVNATDVRQALQWAMNVMPSDMFAGKTTSNAFNAWDYNFRGTGQSLQGGSGPTRNYFTFYQVADNYNVERIEFDRGPNSILFGIGTLGGIVSTYTKMARLDDEFATLELTADTYGGVRATADVNKIAGKKLAIRINALLEDARGWRRNDHNKQAAIDFTILLQPTDNTQVRIDLEGSKAKNTLLQSAINEQVSLWDGVTVADTATTVLPNMPGISNRSGWDKPSNYANYWVYNAATPGAGLQNYYQAYHTVGSALMMAPYNGFYKGTLFNLDPNNHNYPNGLRPSQIPALPEQAYTFGSGETEPVYGVATLWIDHKFSDNLDMTLGAYRYSDDQVATNYESAGGWNIDINRQLPDGSPNPNFGKPFGDFFLSRQEQQRGVSEARLQVNYNFEAGPLNQRFSAALGIQRITWGTRQYNAVKTDNLDPAFYESNLIWGRYYADNAHQGFNLPPGGIISGHPVAYLPWYKFWQDFSETHDLANAALVSHSRLWDDHLSILLGLRYDDYEYNRHEYITEKFINSVASDTTWSGGAIYYFHGLDWLGVFANYSRNFNPVKPGAFDQLDGTPISSTTGQGFDYGIRISTKDGKYYASLSRYDTKAENIIPPEQINFANYWQNYYKALQQPYDTSRTGMNYSDTQSIESTGYEFEVTANPAESIRLMASLALPDSKNTDSMPGSRAYYDAHLAEWQQAVGTGRASGNADAIQAANDLSNQLASGQSTLTSNVSDTPVQRSVDYTANIFANYTFLRGPLKGFAAGAGVTMYGRQYIVTIRNREWHTPSRQNVHLVFGYTTKIRGYETHFALNIDNLLNNRDAVISGYDSYWAYAGGDPVPNGFWLPAPIVFRMSARITF